MYDFLFWLFLAGILIASLQDLKRREVDNWLNLFLLVSGFSFLFFKAIFNLDYFVVILAFISFGIMFSLANLFYYARVFAGGDAKLLLAMFALFVGASFIDTFSNVGLFILFLLLAGSVWGLGFSLFLFFRGFKKVKTEIKKQFQNIYLRYLIFGGIILFVLSYVNWVFLFASIFVLIGTFLFAFGKAMENTIMIKNLSVKELREGDWLVNNVVVGRKTIKADWEGLSSDDLVLLRKKCRRKIKIKEGLPFVPAFFIAFLAYFFVREWLVGLLNGLI